MVLGAGYKTGPCRAGDIRRRLRRASFRVSENPVRTTSRRKALAEGQRGTLRYISCAALWRTQICVTSLEEFVCSSLLWCCLFEPSENHTINWWHAVSVSHLGNNDHYSTVANVSGWLGLERTQGCPFRQQIIQTCMGAPAWFDGTAGRYFTLACVLLLLPFQDETISCTAALLCCRCKVLDATNVSERQSSSYVVRFAS